MPLIKMIDSIGPFYKWGQSGKKYYYIPRNAQSRNKAKQKALKQGRAINASKYKRSI